MHALALLSLVLQSAVAVEPDAPRIAASPAVEAPIAAAAWRFADFDADGLLDAYLLRPREGDCLLRNLGGGEFVDVTSQSGLSGLTGTRLALWRDLDGDGRPDLLLGTSAGELRLFQNLAAPGFVEASARAGLSNASAAPVDGRWVDLDRDALPDLHLVTAEGDRLWRNLGGLVFEPLEPAGLAGRAEGVPQRAQGEMARSATESSRAATLAATLGGVTATGPHGAAAAASFCAAMLLDQATGQCLVASSLPGLGQLLPLSLDFNVQPSGNVGIGTAAPADKLHVAGVVRAEGGVRFADGSLQNSAGASYAAGTGLALSAGTFSIAPNGVTSAQLSSDSASLSKVSGGDISNVVFLNVPDKDVLIGSISLSAPFPGGRLEVREGEGFTPALVLKRDVPASTNSNLARLLLDSASSASARFLECSIGNNDVFQVTSQGDVIAAGSIGAGGVADPQYPVHAESTTTDVIVGQSLGFAGGDGVLGESAGQSSAGVRGRSLSILSPSYGVFGEALAAGGIGVRGIHTSATGGSSGVSGESTSINGRGVSAVASSTTGTTYGVHAVNYSSAGTAVLGHADSPSGVTIGVRGWTNSPNGFAASFGGAAGSANYFQRPVGIATDDPLAELHVAGDSGNADLMLKRSDATHGFNFGVNATPKLFVSRSDGSTYSDILVIDGSTDSVGIGTTAPQFLLHVDGTAGKPGGGSWSTASDARLKTNVQGLEQALERMLALRGVTFEYLDPEAIGELAGERIGVIAQEVERVFPDWVDQRGDGYKAVTFRGFEAVAIEALRELRQEKDAQIAAHEARLARKDAQIAALEAGLARLEGRLSELEGR